MLISTIGMIILFPETIMKLPLLSITENKTITKEQLDGAKEILQHCDWPTEKINKMNEIIFNAEKEYYIRNNPDNATKLFNQIQDDLFRCAYKKDPEPNYFEIMMGYFLKSIDIMGAILTVIGWFGHRKKTGKNII